MGGLDTGSEEDPLRQTLRHTGLRVFGVWFEFFRISCVREEDGIFYVVP